MFISLSVILVHKVFETAKELLTIAPQMAFISDREGNYPLHIAIHNEQSYDTIREIFKACTEVLQIQDAITKLYPLMLAAIGDWKSEKDQISVIYHLMREDPHSLF